MAPSAWKWPDGVVRAVRRRLGLLPGVSGAEVVAAAAVTAAAARWWQYGLPSETGWGASA